MHLMTALTIKEIKQSLSNKAVIAEFGGRIKRAFPSKTLPGRDNKLPAVVQTVELEDATGTIKADFWNTQDFGTQDEGKVITLKSTPNRNGDLDGVRCKRRSYTNRSGANVNVCEVAVYESADIEEDAGANSGGYTPPSNPEPPLPDQPPAAQPAPAQAHDNKYGELMLSSLRQAEWARAQYGKPLDDMHFRTMANSIFMAITGR